MQDRQVTSRHSHGIVLFTLEATHTAWVFSSSVMCFLIMSPYHHIDIMVFILKNYMYANKYAMTYLKCCYSHIVPIKIVAFNLSLRICGKIYQYPYRESSSDKIAE